MSSIGKSLQKTNALQVIRHLSTGMSVIDACRTVGIPRSSFYYFIEHNPEEIAEAQALIEANNQEQLRLILSSKNEILRKVICAGLADDTTPKDRLAIFIKLSEIENKLTKSFRIDNEIERQAAEFLTRGPKLVQVNSRLSVSASTVTIESEISKQDV